MACVARTCMDTAGTCAPLSSRLVLFRRPVSVKLNTAIPYAVPPVVPGQRRMLAGERRARRSPSQASQAPHQQWEAWTEGLAPA